MNTKNKPATRSTGVGVVRFVLNNKAMILLIIAFVMSCVLTKGNTLTAYNLTSLLRQIPAYAIMAIGYTILFATGQFDMSAGSVLSLCTVMFAKWSLEFPLYVALIGSVVLGAFLELLNAFIIRAFNLNAFILTLAMSEVIDGIAGQITGGANISGLAASTKFLGQALLFDTIPVSFLVALAVILIAAVILYRSRFGRHILATGGNLEAAKVSGIKVNFVRIAAFAIQGICAGITAILLTGRLGMGSPTAGSTYTLDCIAAVVIGGTPQKGGKAKVGGSLFGMFLIVVINNMLMLLGINTYWQMCAKGAIIVIAIVLDSLSDKFAVPVNSK